MQHFSYLGEEEKEKIFFKKPQSFTRYTDKEMLSYALGAAMYIPAVHPKLLSYLLDRKYKALTTMVICLEDGIADTQVALAEEMLKDVFAGIDEAVRAGRIREGELPLLFVRPRSTEQLKKMLDSEQQLKYMTGFSLPKFNTSEGERQLCAIRKAAEYIDKPLYAMPILETKAVIDLETGQEELPALKRLIDHYKEYVLNIRIGATDFSSIYGIRRTMDTTIYDISVLRECISRIINVFGKAEDGYMISGPVWEFFSSKGAAGRKAVIDKAEDGLIKEIMLDKVNGLCGKTIIHPSHITYVNALLTVTREEYEDACQILQVSECGVIKSKKSNKMNEIKPHTNWAEKILKRAEIYGVVNEDEDYTALF